MTNKKHLFKIRRDLLIVVGVIILSGALRYCFYSSWTFWGRPLPYDLKRACRDNMRAIGIALRQYHDDWNDFPPVCVKNREGVCLYSWRVLLLPYLGQSELYAKFKLDESWDSVDNFKLLNYPQIPFTFRCNGNKYNTDYRMYTNYVAIVGPSCVFSYDKHPSNCIDLHFENGSLCIGETMVSTIPWSKPEEYKIEDVFVDNSWNKFGSTHFLEGEPGTHFVTVSGDVVFIKYSMPSDVLKNKIVCNQ